MGADAVRKKLGSERITIYYYPVMGNSGGEKWRGALASFTIDTNDLSATLGKTIRAQCSTSLLTLGAPGSIYGGIIIDHIEVM